MMARVLVALVLVALTAAFMPVAAAEGQRVAQGTAHIAGLCEAAGGDVTSMDPELGVVGCVFGSGDLLMRHEFTKLWRACDSLGQDKVLAGFSTPDRFDFTCY